MTEESILNEHCKSIEEDIRNYIDRNDIYNFEELKKDIRTEVQQAMQKARREALRGN